MREALRAYKRHLIRTIYRTLQQLATDPSTTIPGTAPMTCLT